MVGGIPQKDSPTPFPSSASLWPTWCTGLQCKKKERKCHLAQPHNTWPWAESFTHVHLIPATIPMTKQARQGDKTCQIIENSQGLAASSPAWLQAQYPWSCHAPNCQMPTHSSPTLSLLCPAAPMTPGEVVETADGCQVPKAAVELVASPRVLRAAVWPPGTGAPDGILASGLPHPIWLAQREAPLRRPSTPTEV